MELLHTMSLIRKHLPLQFYGLLVVIPGLITAMFAAAAAMLSEPLDSFINIYTITFYLYLGLINLSVWMKLHHQRIGNRRKAIRWFNLPKIVGGGLFIALIFSPL